MRSFLRRFAIAILVVSVLATAALVFGDRFARDKFAASRKVHVPNLAPADPGQPANYLLIGSDTREGADGEFGSAAQVGGQRSDVMMVLHVEPEARKGMLVSFPRDLVVNILSREVTVAGMRVELSAKEFALLATLAGDPERVFTKRELLQMVWDFRSPGKTRTLDSHASRLRQKIARHSDEAWIANVWGVGYRLCRPA